MSKGIEQPSPEVIDCLYRSMASMEPGVAATAANSAFTVALGSTMGSSPFLKQLSKKMSAKEGAISARIP